MKHRDIKVSVVVDSTCIKSYAMVDIREVRCLWFPFCGKTYKLGCFMEERF